MSHTIGYFFSLAKNVNTESWMMGFVEILIQEQKQVNSCMSADAWRCGDFLIVRGTVHNDEKTIAYLYPVFD